MGDNSDSLELFTVVTSVHHKRASESLNDWALGLTLEKINSLNKRLSYLSLSESLGGITTCGVRKIDWTSDVDIIGQRDIANLYIVVGPNNCKHIKTHAWVLRLHTTC
jgi:hypothetical protein